MTYIVSSWATLSTHSHKHEFWNNWNNQEANTTVTTQGQNTHKT